MIINTALSLAVGIALLVTIAIAPTVYAQPAQIVVKHRPIVSQGTCRRPGTRART